MFCIKKNIRTHIELIFLKYIYVLYQIQNLSVLCKKLGDYTYVHVVIVRFGCYELLKNYMLLG